MTDNADGRVCRFGRMTCEAPFLYERWILSLGGEGGRRLLDLWEVPPAGQGSSDDETGDGRAGELPLGSNSESAWKNLVSCWALPIADKGGDGISGLRELSSCCPFA
jgi:hypothetical protein